MADNLIQGLPEFLQDIKEYQILLGEPGSEKKGALGTLSTEATKAVENFEDSMFADTADEKAISMFEGIYKLPRITEEDPEKALEIRRARLLNRMRLRPPYSVGALKDRLNSVLNLEYAAQIEIDYSAQSVAIVLTVSDENLKAEAEKTIARVLPANMARIVTFAKVWQQLKASKWAGAATKTWDSIKEG